MALWQSSIHPAPVFSTPPNIGGSGNDNNYSITVDEFGNAYMAGWTESVDFPGTPSAYDGTFNGVRDGFVAKLDPSGAGLLYATYLGGSGEDYIRDIVVDVSGNAYAVGLTGSPDFPTTAGAYDTTYNGGTRDIFVTKIHLGPPAELPRTGQTTCYAAGGFVIPCAGTGQDGEI